MMWDDHALLVFKGKWLCLHGGIMDVMRCKKYWIILCLVGLLYLGGEGVAAPSQRQSDPPLSKPIFVLLYHPQEENFESAFKDHLTWLKQSGYQTIFPGALLGYLEGKEVSLPAKPILLTFDDGSIENYEIVYPILKEFGYEGTSFVMTGSKFTSNSNKSWWREVDQSGVLRIENHSHSHGLVWVSPSIVDFYSGGDVGNYFLIKGMDWRLGAPVYEFGYELVNERYYPDQRIANLCVDHVAQNGGEEFFRKEGWRVELRQVVENFRNGYPERERYEGETQKGVRFKKEIYGSMKLIEVTIGSSKEVQFFAYPWGVYDEALVQQLKQYGYKGALTIDWGGNYPGDDPFKIKRLTITSGMTVEDLATLLEIY
jgi:peptidoglycan/xylan/chitin deacetylase (PgdA/CDA1 family)